MREETQEGGELFLVTLLLATFGLVMVFSSSYVLASENYQNSFYFFERQLIWLCLGSVAFFIGLKWNYWHWRRVLPLVCLFMFFLLILVLVPGIGIERNGARRWLPLPGHLSFQPSEFAKVVVVLFLAHFLASRNGQNSSFIKGIAPALIFVSLTCGLILLERHLSTVIVIFVVTLIMLFLAGCKKWHLGTIILGALFGFALLIFQEPYRWKRLIALVNPFADPLGIGYNTIHSLVALGSGGPIGLGLCKSIEKYFHLPAPHTDFIFSIIGEELGLLGTGSLFFLFILFARKGFQIAYRCPDYFGNLLAAGLTSTIIFQALINMGMTMACIPVAGVPLPFISYGGSSLVVSMLSVGLLMNISRRGKMSRYENNNLWRWHSGTHLSSHYHRKRA